MKNVITKLICTAIISGPCLAMKQPFFDQSNPPIKCKIAIVDTKTKITLTQTPAPETKIVTSMTVIEGEEPVYKQRLYGRQFTHGISCTNAPNAYTRFYQCIARLTPAQFATINTALSTHSTVKLQEFSSSYNASMLSTIQDWKETLKLRPETPRIPYEMD